MSKKINRTVITGYILVCLASLLLYSSSGFAKSNQTYSALLADYASGVLSHHDYLVYQGYLHFAPGRLRNLYPLASYSQEVRHSTPVIMEIMSNWDILTPAEQKEFQEFFARPVPRPSNNIVTPSGFFKVHYNTSGSHAVPEADEDANDIPDFVDAVIEAADRSLAVYRSIGFRDPHGDTGTDGPQFDIYIQNVTPRNIYGETFFPPDVYMLIDNDFDSPIYSTQGADGARVTLAHELHHAVQFSYSTNTRDVFYWEATSTYFEEKVYPWINDYIQYLPDFFEHPEYSFNRRDGWHEYGLAIWNHFLDKKTGPAVIRKTWEKIGIGQTAIDALDNSLKEENTDFNAALGEFYAWNYFTGSRADTVRYYIDGYEYPMLALTDSVSLTQDTAVTVSNNYLSPGYVYFKNLIPARYSLRVTPPDGINVWENTIILNEAGSGGSLLEFTNGSSSATRTIDHTGGPASMVFVPVSTARSQNTLQGSAGKYETTLDITVTVSEEYEGDRIMANYPNPFIIDEHSETVIPFNLTEAGDVEFYLFSASGRLVKKETLGMQYAGYHPADLRWDGTDDNGNTVGSGIYILHMKIKNKTLSQKIAVIR